MKNIVTQEWLSENLYMGNLIIFDCRYKMGEPDYGVEGFTKHHIPNAVFINVEKDLAGPETEHGGRHPLPDMDGFVALMAGYGVDNDSTVVVYDDGDLSAASRLWWMLKYVGKSKVYVLEGGYGRWIKNDYEITGSPAPARRMGNLKKQLRRNLLCDVDCIRENLGSKDAVIVDSRSPERYKGITEPIDKKAGHIPGAVNYFWQDNLRGWRILPVEQLEKRFEALREYQTIIVHCGSGITAGVNIIAMEEAGLKPRLYLGSWSDWISYPENEIAADMGIAE